jgi:tRNA(Arg) A34 adenosine deaminase TadA
MKISFRKSRKDAAFLRLAMKVAQHSDCSIKHGAVIVRGGCVLGIGFNKVRNTSQLDVYEYNTHAEIDALRNAKVAKNATLYVARINRKGQPRMSLPCQKCLCALEKAQVKRVVFTGV